MKLRSLLAVAVLAAAVGSASAQQEAMLIGADTDGCQLYAPYAWLELAPGQKWSTTVALSGCPASDLGWFRYYGHLGTNNSCDTLKVKDGVVLKVTNPGTQEEFTHAPVSSPRGEEYVLLNVDQPTQLVLTAENTSRQRVKVRMTWLSMAK
jgi:hypothetical protein